MDCHQQCITDEMNAECVSYVDDNGLVDVTNQRCLWADGSSAPAGCCPGGGCPGLCPDITDRMPSRVLERPIQISQSMPSTPLSDKLDKFIVDSNKSYIEWATKLKNTILMILSKLTIQNLSVFICILSSLVLASIFML